MLIALYIIGGIILLGLLIHVFTGKELNIEDTIVINQPVDKVFDYISHIKNQDNYSTWNMMDPDMKKEYSGTDGKVGFVYKWDSSKKKNVGAGEQEIKAIVPNKTLEMELRFLRPMQDVAQSKMFTEPAGGNQTKVKWGFYSQVKFPGTLFKPLIKGMLMKSLVTGLANLKNALEK
jgi:uncharacterized protein YndB with AHSA1/START domain